MTDDTEREYDSATPRDVRAEQVTLGGMLLNADVIGDVVEVIGPVDYYRPAHGVIHRTIVDLYEAGEPTDTIAVAAELARRGDIGKVGGHPYLHDLISAVPVAANAGYYARIVKEHALKRRLIEVGQRITQAGYAPDEDPEQTFDLARDWIDGAFGGGDQADDVDMAYLVPRVIDDLDVKPDDRRPGLSTGFNELDQVLNGLRAGQMIILAARPSVGKSLIAGNIAVAAAFRQGVRTHLHTLEMTRDEMTVRLLAAEASVPMHRLISRQLEDKDWDRLAIASNGMVDKPLFIDDTPSQSLAHIRGKLRAARRKTPAGLVIVDYLQLLSEPGKSENRQTAVAALARGLKTLAREFEVPVLALAQLNRGPEHRLDKKPAMSDLRESGAQEQDADVVLLLHRDDDPDSSYADRIDVIVAKQRNGPKTTVTLGFQGHFMRALDLP